MSREEIVNIKREQIYALMYMPLTKEEKEDRIAEILNKTDEEIMEERIKKTTLKEEIREIIRCLSQNEEGEINEDKKVK